MEDEYSKNSDRKGKQISETDLAGCLSDGSQLELNSLMVEYKNLFDRSNKLDNKVYITLTFCGFLFVFITGIFTKLAKVTVPENMVGKVMMVLYILLCLSTVVSYVYLLIYFMRLLYPEGIERMDPDKIKALQMEKITEEEARRKLIALYRENINYDLIRLKERCNRLTAGLRIVVINVILAFAAYFVQLFI